MVAQLASEQQIHIFLAVLAQAAEKTSSAAGADSDAGNVDLVHLLALGNGDGKAFGVAEAAADTIDDLEKRLRGGETDNTAHSCSCVLVSRY